MAQRLVYKPATAAKCCKRCLYSEYAIKLKTGGEKMIVNFFAAANPVAAVGLG
jgi:hypothetical protein